MRFCYDRTLTLAWEKAVITKVPVLNFLRTYRGPLALFASVEHIDHCVECLEKKEEANPMILRQVLESCRIAGIVFADLAAKMNLSNFLVEVKQQVKCLDDNNFGFEDTKNYDTVCNGKADSLTASGFGQFEKLKFNLPFLTVTLEQVCQGPKDVILNFRMAALTTVAINTGVLPMLPWEQLLFQPGNINGVSATMKVDATPLRQKINCRDYLIKLLGTERLTISQMRKEVNANAKTVRELDRFCGFEMTFLNVFAQPMVDEVIRRQVLGALPSEGNHSSMNQVSSGIIRRISCLSDAKFFELFRFVQVLAKLELIKNSALCYSGGTDLEGEVSGISSLVRMLLEQTPPSKEYVSTCSPFYKTCLKLMENFITTEVSLGCSGVVKTGKLNFASKPTVSKLFGRKALTYLLEEIKVKIDSGSEKVTIKDVGVFRTFHWALDDAQKALTDTWVSTLLSSHLSKLRKIKDSTIDKELPSPAESVKKVSKGSSASSASSSSSAIAAFPSVHLVSNPFSAISQDKSFKKVKDKDSAFDPTSLFKGRVSW